jgi:hypothetical protein
MTTLRVSIETNTPALTNGAKQIPFALAGAINASVKKAQAKQIAHMQGAFTIRRPTFLKQSVKITQFAKKNTLSATLAIDSPGDSDDIFAKFEKRTIKKPTKGTNLAIPIVGSPIRRSERSIVKTIDKPRALLSGSQKGKGARTAFLKPGEGNEPGQIFIKRGAKGKPQLAYVLRPYVPLKPILTFEKIVTDEVERTFSSEFAKSFAHAIATAKK